MNEKFGLGNVYNVELEDQECEEDEECIFLSVCNGEKAEEDWPVIGLNIEDARTLGCQLIALATEMQSRM